MNPHNLSASDLMVWGLVAHLIADWPLQNDWMANNKARFVQWHRIPCVHPAAIVHAAIHGIALTLIFGPFVGWILACTHMVIDQRWPVVCWSKFIRQTQPGGHTVGTHSGDLGPIAGMMEAFGSGPGGPRVPLYDVGLEVRFWTDQVFHIACIAVAALAVAA